MMKTKKMKMAVAVALAMTIDLSQISVFSAFQNVAHASETVKGAKKDFEQFKSEMNVRIEKIEAELAELKKSAADKSDTTKEKSIHELEELKSDLKTKVEKMNEDSSEAWQKLKASIAKSADELNQKIQAALKSK
jgi:Skp family chaperone for outer membrane proteins